MQAKFTLYLVSFLLIIFTPSMLTSQSIFEDLGGAKTNFTILTDNKDMEVVAQGIYSSIIVVEMIDGGASRDVLWLQFISPVSFKEVVYYGRNRKKAYSIQLIDVEGIKLMEFDCPSIWIVPSGELYIYTINIDKIPIILLDKIKTINIVKYTKT